MHSASFVLRHRTVLQAVFGCLILCGFFLVAYPFFPLLLYTVRGSAVTTLGAPAAQESGGQTVSGVLPAVSGTPVPQRNMLRIPKIGVAIPVVEGTTDDALLQGAWRLPSTSDTPLHGNMALSAHRFRYRPPSSETFYLLDKLRVDDVFALTWNGKVYPYRVTQTMVVAPTALEVLDPTPTPTITLVTCTPLFSVAERLVVRGTLTTH